jgi:hypothetical protein
MTRTKQSSVTFTVAIVALATMRLVHAQEKLGQDVLNVEPPSMRLRTPQTIVDSFLRTETQLRQALNQHAFKREVVLQTIGPKGEITGQYVRHSEFLFDDRGNRIERVTYHPRSTIREMRITREDIQDLAGAQLLGVDITEAGKYRLTYRGEELLASTDQTQQVKRVYVISVEPAVQPNPYRMSERYFRGTVWVDAITYQTIKVSGVVEPQGKQRFPRFETWREVQSSPNANCLIREVRRAHSPSTLNETERGTACVPNRSTVNKSTSSRDKPGTFAFPSRTEADDVLHFPNRDVNYRIRVRYYDYKLFASTVSVKELDQPDNLTARTRP